MHGKDFAKLHIGQKERVQQTKELHVASFGFGSYDMTEYDFMTPVRTPSLSKCFSHLFKNATDLHSALML